jgi:peptide/nickel transport system substrate-binding protein
VLSALEKRFFFLALVFCVVGVLFLGSYAFTSKRILLPVTGGTYTEGLIGSPQFINPLYSSSNDVDQDISLLVYSGLMQWHPTEGLITDLAESFTISEDERVYTFTLREDATWHDGTPVLVRDAIFTFNAIQNPEYKSPHSSALRGVVIEQVDDRTVAFSLEEPFAPFLSALTVGILPADYWGDLDPSTMRLAERNIAPIGSGPYKVDEFAKDKRGVIQSYKLVRYAKYYDDSPFIDEIVFKFYPTINEAITALENRNIEGIAFIPKDRLSEFDGGNWQIISPTLPQITGLFFNLKNEYVEDRRVREALGAAIDKEALLQTVLNNQGSLVHSILLQNITIENPVENPTPFNTERSIELLDELGFSPSGERLPIKLTTVDQPETVAVASAIADMWSDVGVDVNISIIDPALFREEVLKERSYDILLSGTLYGADPDPYPFWHSSQATHPGLNLSGYSNRKADELIERGRITSDDTERQETYRELADMINESLPAIFLYQPTYSYVTQSRIRGIDISSIVVPADRFGQIQTWYLKTRHKFRWK